ncbi:MAG: carboxypeptidase-like regulatory domain-containing protein [Acidimicrobiales bacterium]
MHDRPDPDQPAGRDPVSRRRALGLGAAAAAGAWVAPQVLSTAAAAAATLPPSSGTILGVLRCGADPYGNPATVSATPVGGGTPITTTSDPQTGTYTLVVPAGDYDVSAEFGASGPTDYLDNPVTVASGATVPGIDIEMPC